MKHITQGGLSAHLARRLFHICMIFTPFIYYYFLINFATPKILHLIILAFIFFIFLLEKLRLRMRLVLFGQRLHEARHISAFAWTMLSLGVVFILSPSAPFSIAIVATCALVDPLLGEMRSFHVNQILTVICGIILALIIWMTCAWVYHFPMWIGLVIAPISVAAEWPSLKWIDDNALMMMVPLIVLILLNL
ncbi:MAG: hypothetical protein A3E82_06120 [Gammaproteobacteria bacterium RIFCSPHIGHO2_12_FULL_38_11]|nr:MAG: hypothetical protein A3E82_06120 [Gammaproteobacteria bacterium RIFCSPHIGHO2_12_FULL_38_11]